jgi:hypothetical protein
MAVYDSDPDQEDDSGFVRGKLEHLVVGSHGRLLDARRTPVAVVAADPSRGSFVVEIEAFEDRGARWELALDEVEHFQFPRSAPIAPSAAIADLTQAHERFSGELHVEVDRGAREATLEAIAAEQQGAVARLTAAMWRQRLTVERVFMTFLETAALNERFLEAEAVLIADPANSLF